MVDNRATAAQITAQQSKIKVPQDFLWCPPSIKLRGFLMVSPWAPKLTEVHTKHHHKANLCRTTRCHVCTAIRFKSQTHLNMIAGDANAGPSRITKEAATERRGWKQATWICRLAAMSGAKTERSERQRLDLADLGIELHHWAAGLGQQVCKSAFMWGNWASSYILVPPHNDVQDPWPTVL